MLNELIGIAGVYKITNPDGEIYLGSSDNIRKRWFSHISQFAGSGIKESMKKHGSFDERGVWISNHTIEVILKLPEFTPKHILEYFERSYGRRYKREGYKFLNATAPGQRGRPKQPILQLDLNGNKIKRWPCQSEAANALGIFQGGISSVCLGNTPTYYGYKWCFAKKKGE